LLDLYKKASKNLNIDIDKLYQAENYLNLFNLYLEENLYFKHFKKFYTDEDILQT
jgi:hypothetical protein